MVSITEEELAQDALKYLRRAESGETIVIMRGGVMVARIERPAPPEQAPQPYKYTGPLVDGLRPAGLCKGQVFVADDFDAPLPDDILDAFEGR